MKKLFGGVVLALCLPVQAFALCSPSATQDAGEVVVVCEGLDAFVQEQLNGLLGRERRGMQTRLHLAEDWVATYEDASVRLKEEAGNSEQAQLAYDWLVRGWANMAGDALDKLLAEPETRVERAAALQYLRAELFALEFRSVEALVKFHRAHYLRPENTVYALAYAHALLGQNHYSYREQVTMERAVGELAREAGEDDRRNGGMTSVLKVITLAHENARRLEEAESALQGLVGNPAKRAQAELLEAEIKRLRTTLGEYNKDAHLQNVARVRELFSSLYQKTRNLVEVGRLFETHLPKLRAFARDNPGPSGLIAARYLLDQAQFYKETGRWQDAEAASLEALAEYQAAAQRDPQPGLVGRVAVLVELAAIYEQTGRIDKAEHVYQQAFQEYAALPDTALPAGVAEMIPLLNKLTRLYQTGGRAQMAEDAYAVVLASYHKLSPPVQAAYQVEITELSNTLGMIYQSSNRPALAEKAYQEALAGFQKLAQSSPDAYQPQLAETFRILGKLYSEAGQRPESGDKPQQAEQAYLQAAAFYRRLADVAPLNFRPLLAVVLNELGDVHRAAQHPEQAEQAYEDALKEYYELVESTPITYLPEAAAVLRNLGDMRMVSGRVAEAILAYRKSAVDFQRVAQAAPDQYLGEAANSLEKLGQALKATGKEDEGEMAIRAARDLRNVRPAPPPGS